MPSEFPPRPSRRATVALAVIALFTLLYSLIVAGQILLWFILAGGAIGLYLTWLLIIAVFRLVEAVERIATAAEVDSGIRDPAEPEAPSRRASGETPANDTPDSPQATPTPDVSNRQDDTPAGEDSDGGSGGDDSTHTPAPDDFPDRE